MSKRKTANRPLTRKDREALKNLIDQVEQIKFEAINHTGAPGTKEPHP